MTPHKGSEDRHTVTTTLKRLSPGWAWVRENFSLASVLAIAGVVIAAGSYIISLKTSVVLLQHEVIHITQIVPSAGMLAGLNQEVSDHEQRITRLENDWDTARQAASLPPTPSWRRVRPRR